MLVKTCEQHSMEAGQTRRTASIVLDRAVLDVVAVLACAVGLVICAMHGDSAGVASTAGALGVVLKLRHGSEGKAL